jgi:hypothetical protein
MSLMRRAPAVLAIVCLAACDNDPGDKIAADHRAQARNSQTAARELFDGLCAQRELDAERCACLRTRMLGEGTRALAFIGASYGGDLQAAADAAAQMDEAARAAAIAAYFAADAACAASGPDDDAGDSMPSAPATLDDVRASCRPAMADVCVCRAQALERAIGDGAFDAAVAINTGDTARLESLARGRAPGWADLAASAYARTSAPCVMLAGVR